jgi:hypothetical protein
MPRQQQVLLGTKEARLSPLMGLVRLQYTDPALKRWAIIKLKE